MSQFANLVPTEVGRNLLLEYAKLCEEDGVKPNTGFLELLEQMRAEALPGGMLDLSGRIFLGKKGIPPVLKLAANKFEDVAELRISQYYLEATDVMSLVELISDLPGLTSLDLSKNPITDEVVPVLSSLIEDLDLCLINIEGTFLSDQSIEKLMKQTAAISAKIENAKLRNQSVPTTTKSRKPKPFEGKPGLQTLCAAAGGVMCRE